MASIQWDKTGPLDWKPEPTPAPGATLAAVLVPEQAEPGTVIEFTLVDGENAAKMIQAAPLIPSAATVVGTEAVEVGGHKLHRSEWHARLKGRDVYQHAATLQGAIGERFVSLRCFTSGPGDDGPAVNARFAKWRDVFENVLRSVRIIGALGTN